ncbi:DNA-binding response OmpR family regulator [Rossellomorea marisflavi]
MHILLAEDDETLGELIVHLLRKKGVERIDWVVSGEEAHDYALASYYDVIIMDWMMPGGDGVEICRRLRSGGYGGAILMLTARDGVEDCVEGFEAGADDYLVKPSEIAELHARLKALARRNLAPLQSETIGIRGVILNRTSHSLMRDGEEIYLTPREFQLLDMLVRNQNQTLSRDLLLDRIWGIDADVSHKTVDATVKLLRKKIGEGLIETVRGVGYRIET